MVIAFPVSQQRTWRLTNAESESRGPRAGQLQNRGLNSDVSPAPNLYAIYHSRSPPPPEILPGLYPCRAVTSSCLSVLKNGQNQASLTALLRGSTAPQVRSGVTGDHEAAGEPQIPRKSRNAWMVTCALLDSPEVLPFSWASTSSDCEVWGPPITPAERLKGPRRSSQPQLLAPLAYFIYLYCYFLKLW